MEDSKPEKQDISASMRRLQDALWNAAEDEISHAECRAALPQFVEEEAAGIPVSETYPRIQRHLDHCNECGEEYAIMLDLALAEQRGELDYGTKPTEELQPVRWQRRAPLQNLVLEWTRALMGKISPQNLSDLDGVAATFFRQLTPRQANESRAGYEVGASNSNVALSLLAASYATTKAFCDEVTVGQFDGWLSDGTLTDELHRRAVGMAREAGMDTDAADAFGKAFAEQVMSQPETMRGLMKRV